MIVTAAVAVIVWGALAFGAVYPWAFTPLLTGCAAVGLWGIMAPAPASLGRPARAAIMALICVMAAGLLQLVPLPPGVLRTVSPATDAFLQNYDLTYALASSGGGQAVAPDGLPLTPVWHPFSLAPRSTRLGLAIAAALTLLLAGLSRSLSVTGVRRLAALIVTFGVVLGLIGIVQKTVLGDHAYAGMKIYGIWSPANLLSTPFGPFINKNHFAGWMLMVIPLALGLAMGKAETGMRHVHGSWRARLLWLSSPAGGRVQLIILAVLVMGASVLMTKSRSGMLCLGISMILVSIVARRRFGSARAGWAALGSLAVMFATLFFMAGSDVATRMADRGEAMNLRQDIWADSLAVVRSFPLTGTGLNTFGTAMISYQTAKPPPHFQEAHNDYLQVLVEGGLLMALPALLAIGLAVRAIRSRFGARADDGETYWIRAGAVIGLIAIALQAGVEFSLQMPGNAALFVVLLAIAIHEPPPARTRPVSRGEEPA